MMFARIALLVLGCHLCVSAIPMVTYQNARFVPSTNSQFIGLFYAQSQDQCACFCLVNDSCRTATYLGINSTCLLYSANVQLQNLQLMTLTFNATVLTFRNKSIATTIQTTTSSSTTTTSTTTTNQLCGSSCVNSTVSQLSRVAFYSFDNNTWDAMGNYSMNGTFSPSYVPGWIGSAVSFNYSNQQFLSTSYIPLNSRSFTIDFWFYATDVTSVSDFTFGGECQSSSSNKCLFLNIRSKVLFLGFFNADTGGTTTISINQWYHVAFVYDYTVKQQSIYLNGILERSSTVVNPLLATSGSFTIGGAYIGGSTQSIVYYSGYIDHFTISSRVKSACEIYLSATLACYFSFDSTPSLVDAGPNFLTATNTGGTATMGRVNQALQFSSALSYVSIKGISALNVMNGAFTIAMWIQPSYVSQNATLISTSTQADGTGDCVALWSLTTTGLLTVNVVNSSNNTIAATTSSLVPLNTWTHIAQVFSTTTGNSLYVSGRPVANVSTSSRRPMGPYVFLGASPANTSHCTAGSLSMGQFAGSIDEYYVFGQALTSTDICRLANP